MATKNRFRISLASKLALSVFLILITGTLTQGIFTLKSLSRGIAESDQRRAFGILQSLVKDVERNFPQENNNLESVFGVLLKFSTLNPTLTPILLNNAGEILLSSKDTGSFPNKKINIEPLENFSKKIFPSYIENPIAPNEDVLFAVKEIETPSFKGFLLLILEDNSKNQENLVSATKKSLYSQIGIIALFSVLLGYFLTNTITKRLNLLSKSLIEYSPENITSIQPLSGSDEISDLSRSFTRMASDIKLAFEKLSERDTLRRELVAGVSHDLKTPLSSIQGYVQQLKRLLARNEATPEIRDDYLNTIEKNALILTNLTESLSELIKLDHSVAQLKRENILLKPLIEEIIKRFNPILIDKRIDFNFSANKDTELFVDKILVERAIANLIDNAIRHTKSKIRIKISASDSVLLSVEDDGLGVSESELLKIFEPFYRGDKARDKDKGGSGLGLAITKSIIVAHGGEISVGKSDMGGALFNLVFKS